MRQQVASLQLVFLVLLCGQSEARTWHVSPNGTGDASTIQAAVDSAKVGDDVLLAPGTYTWDSQHPLKYYMVLMKPGIWLHGEAGPEATILDVQGHNRGIQGPSLDNATTIEGITIMNGNAVGNFSHTDPPKGGGIYCTGTPGPVITNCIFRNNKANGNDAEGGGARVNGAIIEGCQFINNLVGPGSNAFGGGLWCGATSIPVTNCRFQGNVASGGDGTSAGGAILSLSAAIRNCVFESNKTGAFHHGTGGGAIHEWGILDVSGCEFSGNSTGSLLGDCSGGAIESGGAGSTVSDCVFLNNIALAEQGRSEGGAISAHRPITISRCIFIENAARRQNPYGPGYGGAIFVNNGGLIENCTVFGNSGSTVGDGVGGISMFGGGTIRATILAGNFGAACEGSATWICCDVFGNQRGDALCGTDGGGNFNLDPLFCSDPLTSLSVLLQSNSPCLPRYHPASAAACDLIGKESAGCTVAVERRTWSAVKVLYR